MNHGIFGSAPHQLNWQITNGIFGSSHSASGPVFPSPLAIWTMNEGSGLILHDTGGSSDTATLSSAAAVTWQINAGLPGTTPLWTGAGNALTANTTLLNFDGTTPFTASAWIQFSGGMVGSTLFGNLNPSNNFQGWEFATQNVGNFGTALRLFVINSYPSNAIDVSSTAFISAGLHHLVATYDGSKKAAGMKLYIDGVLSTNSVTVDTLTSSAANGLPVRFGARSDGTQELVNNAMAFVRVYNVALTAAQITTLFGLGPQ